MEVKFGMYSLRLCFSLKVIVVGRITCEIKNQVVNYQIHDGTGALAARLYIGPNNLEMSKM